VDPCFSYSRLTDYHLHTPLCHHAEGWPVEFARAALRLGLAEIGFADHNPMPGNFDDWRMSIDDFPRYLETVQQAREAFPQLTIRLGLECDFIPGYEKWIEQLAGMAEWDYLIGSVHYLPEGWEVDQPKYVARHAGNADEIWKGYWTVFEQCVRSQFFDFVAHPDLPKKFGFRPAGELRRFYEPAVQALADGGVPFEINTAGLRKECRELYPAREFVTLAQEAEVGVLINSDAHAPAELGAGFEEAATLAKSVGYKHVIRFERRKPHAVPLD
jgi:histidinol-phosphatase (PHP family)